ncbi:Uncharacterised protein [Vibrio cholerae]|nr:Uncharacterised protein [Vibrio cholerae]
MPLLCPSSMVCSDWFINKITSALSFFIVSIVPEISLTAFTVLTAKLRTSSATTANPRPCSPARAASIAALSANKFVCSAIPLMMSITESTLAEACSSC